MYNPEYGFNTWLIAIAKNVHIDMLRKKKSSLFIEMNDEEDHQAYSVADESNSAEDELIIEQNLAQLLQYVKQLKPAYQEVIQMRWRKGSISEFRAVLEPISSHGKWAGKEPFVATAKDWDGQVVAITRARIKWSQNFRFWSSVPPVTVSLKSAPGLVAAIGIGEAPIGLQGTFSLWESAAAIREFAYKGAAHQKAIADTSAYNWYSEELFARFAVREVRGTLQ